MKKQILFSIALIGYITNSALAVEKVPSIRDSIQKRYPEAFDTSNNIYKVKEIAQTENPTCHGTTAKSTFPNDDKKLSGKEIIICEKIPEYEGNDRIKIIINKFSSKEHHEAFSTNTGQKLSDSLCESFDAKIKEIYTPEDLQKLSQQ